MNRILDHQGRIVDEGSFLFHEDPDYFAVVVDAYGGLGFCEMRKIGMGKYEIDYSTYEPIQQNIKEFLDDKERNLSYILEDWHLTSDWTVWTQEEEEISKDKTYNQ